MDLNALIAVVPPPMIKYWAKLGITGVNSSLFICLGSSSSARRKKKGELKISR
jgi:hypothetical protein